MYVFQRIQSNSKKKYLREKFVLTPIALPVVDLSVDGLGEVPHQQVLDHDRGVAVRRLGLQQGREDGQEHVEEGELVLGEAAGLAGGVDAAEAVGLLLGVEVGVAVGVRQGVAVRLRDLLLFPVLIFERG